MHIVIVLVLVLAACGSAPADGTAAPSPPAAGTSRPAARDTLTGVLAGDAQLEGGCVWLDTDVGRVEVVWPDGYRASADPVELRDPDGDVIATGGDEVRIEGAPASDLVSTCQVGAIWTATAVAPG